MESHRTITRSDWTHPNSLLPSFRVSILLFTVVKILGTRIPLVLLSLYRSLSLSPQSSFLLYNVFNNLQSYKHTFHVFFYCLVTNPLYPLLAFLDGDGPSLSFTRSRVHQHLSPVLPNKSRRPHLSLGYRTLTFTDNDDHEVVYLYDIFPMLHENSLYIREPTKVVKPRKKNLRSYIVGNMSQTLKTHCI